MSVSIKKIVAQDITKAFVQGETTQHVLAGISQSFERGSTYAITGVSGTGKSTFLHVLAGLDEPTSGAVFYNANNIAHVSLGQRSAFLNKSIGLVFQLPYLLREFTVVENVMMPGLIAGESREQCRLRALELLDKVGIPEKADAAPTTLSGGQQQRVAIARALFHEPDFLLADEPTGNLDIQTGKAIVDVLRECQSQWGMGMIISSHDAYVADSMEKVFRLHDGVLSE